MSLEELKEVLKSKHINSWVKIYKDSSEIQDYLFLLYNSRASSDVEIFGLFYLVMNDLNEKPKAYCGDDSKFIKYGRGYAKFCTKYNRSLKSSSCSICHEELYKSRNIKSKLTNLKIYGTEISQQSNTVKEKVKKTNLERYGYESHNSNPEIKTKKQNIIMERYGVDNVCKIYSYDEKKEIYQNKTGYDHPLQNPQVRERIKQTNIIRYGGNSPTTSNNVIQKQKQTNIEKYGVDSHSKTEDYRRKCKETSIRLYKSEFYSKTEEYRNRVTKSNIERRFVSASRNSNLIPKFNIDDLYGKNHTDFFKYECIHCNEEVISRYNAFSKCPCQKKSGVSIQEKDLLEYIISLIPDVEVLTNVRDVIAPKELDIYIPSLNLAFEYNGMYWHSTEHKEKRYHQEKVLSCLEKGINLIHIFEDEWNDEEKCNIIKNRIMSKINSTEKIYARKCTVRSVHKEVSDKFVNENHIQGSTLANIHLGLYFNEILVAIMTFGKSRFDKNIEYELIRYCSTGTIVGGASKLLKEFERTYNPKSLVSYADMNWSNGNLYEKIGFINEGHTECGYFYYDPELKIRISRQRCQKHKLVKAGHDPNLTETQICSDILGYYRIYDSGNWKFTKRY